MTGDFPKPLFDMTEQRLFKSSSFHSGAISGKSNYVKNLAGENVEIIQHTTACRSSRA